MTEKPVDRVEGLIAKPGAHGRRTYSPEGKRALVELSKSPGVSVAGLALAHGINANLLRRWIVQSSRGSVLEVERRTPKRAALLPVKMADRAHRQRRGLRAQSRSASGPRRSD